MFRIEEKIVATRAQAQETLGNLLENGADYLFPNRRVSSCYFDTRDFRVFRDSEEGVLPRRKIRIRNYNDVERYTLEVKTSSLEGRYKTSQKLTPEVAKKHFKFSLVDSQLGVIGPVVVISYDRSYLQIEKFRVTIDTNIRYGKFGHSKAFVESQCVIEIKASLDQSIAAIDHFLPMQRRRFSKYCRAINAIKPHGLMF